MSSENELPKIETFVLKVHMHCQGCVTKVRKVLQKIEGVYKVDINAEEQKVIIIGSVNASALVKKLAKFGKHAEIWNSEYNPEQVNHGENNNNQAQYIIHDLSAYENPYMISTFYEKDQRRLGWHFDQHMSAKTMESKINEPLFLDKVNNETHHNSTIIHENPKWVESLVPIMRPASFHQNRGSYLDLESQEWIPNLLEASPTHEFNYQPSV